jgi:hypothetical protein
MPNLDCPIVDMHFSQLSNTAYRSDIRWHFAFDFTIVGVFTKPPALPTPLSTSLNFFAHRKNSS